jgi:hypothetical protein
MTETQWLNILWYRPSDFNYPAQLDDSVVAALDQLTQVLRVKGRILSDWRPVSADRPGSQHPLGRAIDVAWPSLDPLKVLDVIKSARLFSGYGLYRNEKGVCSFHVDTRTNRSVDNPATWGAFISAAGTERSYEYTGLQTVVDFVKSHAAIGIVALGVAGWLLWQLFRRT